MANVKCPYCPQKFPTHHGLGGHLSGPCGAKLKAAKDKAKAPPRKASRIVIDYGRKMNAELREDARTKVQAAIPSKLASDLRGLAAVHRSKAEEIEKMATRIEAMA